jgi:hypothetical protein
MHSITKHKNTKSNIFVQNAQYYKAQEYEIKYLCTKCTILQSTRIRNQITLYKMHSITKHKNTKLNIFVQNAQYYKAQEYEIKYLCTK